MKPSFLPQFSSSLCPCLSLYLLFPYCIHFVIPNPKQQLMSILIERSGASSNIPSSGLQRFGVLCHCNLDAPLMTLWIEDNPSRRFFDCGLYKVCSIDNLDASLITVDFFFFNFFCSLFIYFMFLIFNLFKYGILSSIIEICNRLNRLFFFIRKRRERASRGSIPTM